MATGHIKDELKGCQVVFVLMLPRQLTSGSSQARPCEVMMHRGSMPAYPVGGPSHVDKHPIVLYYERPVPFLQARAGRSGTSTNLVSEAMHLPSCGGQSPNDFGSSPHIHHLLDIGQTQPRGSALHDDTNGHQTIGSNLNISSAHTRIEP